MVDFRGADFSAESEYGSFLAADTFKLYPAAKLTQGFSAGSVET